MIVYVLIMMINCNIVAIIKSINETVMNKNKYRQGEIDYEWHRKKSQ